jgi:hypothetical protein
MRAQIFAPEIARDMGREPSSGHFKKPLELHIWNAIKEYASNEVLQELTVLRGGRSLRELALAFVHPPHATRSDASEYENWGRIVTALDALQPLEKRRMGDGLSYGLKLATEVGQADREIVASAIARFGGEPASVLGKVARLVRDLPA